MEFTTIWGLFTYFVGLTVGYVLGRVHERNNETKPKMNEMDRRHFLG